MCAKQVLFISGSFGLGHVYRDLAIAAALRDRHPEVEISWLAAEPARSVIGDAGETLIREADQYANDTEAAEGAARGAGVNILDYLLRARRQWEQNVDTFRQVVKRMPFDLVIGDETYEIAVALKDGKVGKTFPFVMIWDFVGLDAITWNPKERLGIFLWNRIWASSAEGGHTADLNIFIGELEDIPDRRFDLLLPNRREFARRHYRPVGYILSFKPEEYADRAAVRARLGYGNEPLVVCSIGGTAIGRQLLELCGRAYPIVAERLPGLRMMLVCGPRVRPDSIDVPPGVDVKGYVPGLYQHFAACNLAVVQAGGTTTLELTALRQPFLYFPMVGQVEQERYVAGRLARHGAGVRMSYAGMTPELLAGHIVSNIGKEVTYPPIPVDGAVRAAVLTEHLLFGETTGLSDD